MSCQSNADQNQTEFEFFQQIMSNSKDACSGPIVEIGFTSFALDTFKSALHASGMPVEHLDKISEHLLDSSAYLAISFCAKHWFIYSIIIGKQGLVSNNLSWQDLALYLFRLICSVNNWDHKEVTNYIRTYNTLKNSESGQG